MSNATEPVLREHTVAELIRASHAMAVQKGWWDSGIDNRSIAEQFVNFHAEISEAWEEYRSDQMATWFQDNGKPEGFWVEIADLLIRIADTLGAYQIAPRRRPTDWGMRLGNAKIGDVVNRLHQMVGFSTKHDEFTWEYRLTQGAADTLGDVMALCFTFAEAMHIELWEVIELKMEFNATRPHRHGGKLA